LVINVLNTFSHLLDRNIRSFACRCVQLWNKARSPFPRRKSRYEGRVRCFRRPKSSNIKTYIIINDNKKFTQMIQCQFHQHFSSSFLWFLQLFCGYTLSLWFFCQKEIGRIGDRRMLVNWQLWPMLKTFPDS